MPKYPSKKKTSNYCQESFIMKKIQIMESNKNLYLRLKHNVTSHKIRKSQKI
jgi:hypothetical protein